jgi:hypothetical protein
MEYAELKDMKPTDRIKYFCDTYMKYAMARDYSRGIWNIYKDSPSLGLPDVSRRISKASDATESCKKEVDRIKRVLDKESITPTCTCTPALDSGGLCFKP